MNESLEHQIFVKRIVEYVRTIVPNEYLDRIRADLPEHEKPMLAYDNFIPDVLYSYGTSLIIGEAKTFDDYNRNHSRRQYEAYVKECKNFPGRSMIVIAGPWQLYITAKNHFLQLKKKYDAEFSIVVISENGLSDVI